MLTHCHDMVVSTYNVLYNYTQQMHGKDNGILPSPFTQFLFDDNLKSDSQPRPGLYLNSHSSTFH